MSSSRGVPAFTVPEAMREVMLAVASTLVSAQALELTLAGLWVAVDKRNVEGVPLEEFKARADLALRDSLGNLITKLQQATGAANEDVRFLRDLRDRRDYFVHNFCVRPPFVMRSETPEGRADLIQELWDLSVDLETARRDAGRYTLLAAGERLGITQEALLEDLQSLAIGERESRVLPDDFVAMFRVPGMMERAEAILSGYLASGKASSETPEAERREEEAPGPPEGDAGA